MRRVISNEISHEFDLVAEVQRLQAELARLKSLPVVPASDHRRACDARDEALAQVDALTRKLANLEAAEATISRLRWLISRLLRQLPGSQMSTHEEQADVREARAACVEGGEQ
jgi:C4-dicarboxylate-specific signal transduction histidine kinase